MMKNNLKHIWGIFFALLLICSGCCSKGGEQAPPQSESPTVSVSADASPTLVPTQTPQPEPVEITVAGSTSVDPVVEALADMYTQRKPYVHFSFEVTGSGAGIVSCGDSTADIGLSSRELKEEEHALYPEMTAMRLCKEVVVVVVNSGNPIDSLTAEQVKAIFLGEITNWQDIGGESAGIHLYRNGSVTGIWEAFQILFLGKDSNGEQIEIDESLFMDANFGLSSHRYDPVDEVRNDPAGITFMLLGKAAQAEGIKVLTINGIEPNAQTVLSGEYGYYWNFYMLTIGAPEGEVAAFIEYCLTDPEAIAYLTEKGFIVG